MFTTFSRKMCKYVEYLLFFYKVKFRYSHNALVLSGVHAWIYCLDVLHSHITIMLNCSHTKSKFQLYKFLTFDFRSWKWRVWRYGCFKMKAFSFLACFIYFLPVSKSKCWYHYTMFVLIQIFFTLIFFFWAIFRSSP